MNPKWRFFVSPCKIDQGHLSIEKVDVNYTLDSLEEHVIDKRIAQMILGNWKSAQIADPNVVA